MRFRQLSPWLYLRPKSSVRSRSRVLLQLEMLEQRLAPALKGLASYDFQVPAIQSSWSYNWGGTVPTDIPSNVGFVPLAWGYYGNTNNSFVNWLNWCKSQPGVREMLGFNEPDSASQSPT
jgi:hypothetical protein